MIGRNAPCPCGSGRKYKKCCVDKKKDDRVSSVTMDMGEPTVINGVKIDANGNFALLNDGKTITPQNAYLTHSIVREDKKDKVTSNVPIVDVANLTANLLDLIGNLDYLFIIDTNTVELPETMGEESKSACAIQHFQRVGNQFAFVNGIGKIFNHSVAIHGEKIALVELIKYILFDLKIGEDKLIGIVTDHDLGNHPKYNLRELPIIEGTELYLPEHISFIYASADKKNENFLTRLINECDKKATELLNKRE